jgi:Iron-containing redox enzyme
LPQPRGELSDLLLSRLGPSVTPIPVTPFAAVDDPLSDEDLQLALYVAYELHYRGFEGVDPAWEWEPSLLAVRRELERAFEDALRRAVGEPLDTAEPEETDLALRAIADADDAPPASRFIERQATRAQVLEFLVHRSAYQLKEADPHTFAIPRLTGGAKAAAVEIQADEYGGGRADRMHAALFAKSMRAAGLDDTYGAYLDRIPGVTLATVNLMSLLGLHRRLRGAAAGHLALFEMTSSVPNGRYARGLRRLGFGDDACDFFDEHVVADAVHENIAAVDLAGGLARQEPGLAADVLWGARALVCLDARWARHLMDAWEAGVSSLRVAPAEPAAQPAGSAP